MKDEEKTKEQLIHELVEARRWTVELEAAGTERKRAEESLREAHLLLDKTFSSLNEAVFVVDPDTRAIIACNQAVDRIFGYSEHEVVGRNTEFVHVDRAMYEKFGRELFPALDADGVFHTEHQCLRKDGSSFFTEHTVTEMVNDSGHRTGLVSIVRDITERRRAEEEIRRQSELLQGLHGATARFVEKEKPEETFQRLLDTILELTESEYGFIGEVLFTPEGKPHLKTRAITNIAWDQTSRELVESASDGLEFHNLETLFGHVVTGQSVVISNDPANDPRSGGLPPGHPPLRAFMGTPFFHGGKMVGMAGVANRPGGYDAELAEFLAPFSSTCGIIIAASREDLERKRAEEELWAAHEGLQSAYEKLERTQEQLIRSEKLAAVGRLTAGVSHEILNPLNIISMSHQLMLDDPATPQAVAQQLDILQGQVHRITKITQDLLSFSRQREPERCPVDVNEVITRTLGLMESELRLDNIKVELRLAEALPHIMADQDQIEQVVLNLLANARDAMPGGGRLSLLTDMVLDDGQRFVELRVENTGPNIAPEHLDKLFDPFFTTKPEGEGTGLGLSICQGIIESHGGSIRVENVSGGGVVFTVRLS